MISTPTPGDPSFTYDPYPSILLTDPPAYATPYTAPPSHYVDWTKCKTLGELTAALNSLRITVASDCAAFEELKPYLKDTP